MMPSDGIGDELRHCLIHSCFCQGIDHFCASGRVINRWAAVQALLVRFCVLANIMQKPSQSRSFAGTKFGSSCGRLGLGLDQVLP